MPAKKPTVTPEQIARFAAITDAAEVERTQREGEAALTAWRLANMHDHHLDEAIDAHASRHGVVAMMTRGALQAERGRRDAS